MRNNLTTNWVPQVSVMTFQPIGTVRLDKTGGFWWQTEKQLRALFQFLSPIQTQSETRLGQCSKLFRLLMTGNKVTLTPGMVAQKPFRTKGTLVVLIILLL